LAVIYAMTMYGTRAANSLVRLPLKHTHQTLPAPIGVASAITAAAAAAAASARLTRQCITASSTQTPHLHH